MFPMHTYEVRIEAENALEGELLLSESIQADGLSIRWISTDPETKPIRPVDGSTEPVITNPNGESNG